MTNINILVCGIYDLHHYLKGQGQQGLEICYIKAHYVVLRNSSVCLPRKLKMI